MEEKNKTNHYYISLPSQKSETDIIDFEMKMLEQNRIRGLLPAAREYQDTEVKIYFDISGRQNLEQRYVWQKMTGREVRQILRTIAEVASELGEYMLDYNHLNLMPEFMYGMLDPGDLCFCYEPWDSETFGERLRPLALWFLDHMDYREREEVIFSYEFQRFCDENDVSLALLEQFMAGKADMGNLRGGRAGQNSWESDRTSAGAGAEAGAQPETGAIQGEGREKSGGAFSWEETFSDTDKKKNGSMKDIFRRIFPSGEKRYPDFTSMESLRVAEDETEYGRETTRGRRKARAKKEGDSHQKNGTGRNVGEVYQRGNPDENVGEAYQRGNPDGNVSEAYQRGNSDRNVGEAHQRGNTDRNVGEAYQRGNPDGNAGKAYQNGVPGRNSGDMYPKDNDASFSEAGEEVNEKETILGELTSRGMPTLHICGFPCFLGRDGELTDCEIADESVSRIHVRLFLADDHVWAEDLRSENGTFINGDRMLPNEPWVLKDGDELKIGDCPYRFHRKI